MASFTKMKKIKSLLRHPDKSEYLKNNFLISQPINETFFENVKAYGYENIHNFYIGSAVVQWQSP